MTNRLETPSPAEAERSDPYEDGWPDAEANMRGCFELAWSEIRRRGIAAGEIQPDGEGR
jgi:hypothetical protein